jgi:parvulin-like peptidyl-prolyl isomerase
MRRFRCLCIFATGAFFAAACVGQPTAFLDGIAATVNDSVITYLQVDDQIASQINAARLAATNASDFYNQVNQIRKNELELMEQSKLILDDFTRGEYTTNWVDEAVEDAIKLDIKNTFGGNRNNLIKTLQADGRTYEDYKKMRREKVIVDELAEVHTGFRKIVISPTAIEQYYNQHLDKYQVEDKVKLRMIQIPESAGSKPGEARELAGEILHEINGGAPFAEMAMVNSTGSKKASGGDWGWVERKDLLKELADAAFALKPGQHSEVVEVPGEGSAGATFCILMADDFRPAHATPLPEAQADIERTLQNQRGKIIEDQWISRLQAKSRINTY